MRTSVFFTILLAFVANVSGFDPASSISSRYATRFGEPSGVVMDSEEKIWIGSNNAVIKHELNSQSDPFANEVGTIFFGNDLRQIAIEGDYAYAAGSEGFVKYNIPDETTEEITLLPSTYTWSVAADRDAVMVSTDNGLAKVGSNDVYWKGSNIKKVVRAADGSFWCSDMGDFIGRVQDNELTVYEDLGHTGEIAADPNGGIWASAGGALWRFDGSWTKIRECYSGGGLTGVPSGRGFVDQMIIDHYGVIWGFDWDPGSVGSPTVGYLVRYDIANDELESFELGEHFPWIEVKNSNVYAALGLDNQGRLLIAGNEKVAYVTDNELPVINPLRLARGGFGIRILDNGNGFVLSSPAQVDLAVFTASGRLIQRVSGRYNAGNHTFPSFFSGATNANFVRLRVGKGETITAKTLILR